MKFPRIILLVAAILLILIILTASPKSGSSRGAVRTIDGPINVSYTQKTAAGVELAMGPQKAKSIQIFDNYVIIVTEKREGTLLPISELRNLRWSKK